MGVPVTVCHRGASALAPDNSIEAFQIAMQHGVDFSELDVHVDANGELIVTHDPPTKPGSPRLSEVFELVRGHMGLYVELKGPDTASRLGHLVGQGTAEGVQLMSGSFVLSLVEQLRQAAPEIPRSILFNTEWRGRLEAMVNACHELGATYAHPCFRPVEPPLIDALHAAGLLVMTPHTNDPAEAHYFAEIGVDVVASDDPRILNSLVRHSSHRTGAAGSR